MESRCSLKRSAASGGEVFCNFLSALRFAIKRSTTRLVIPRLFSQMRYPSSGMRGASGQHGQLTVSGEILNRAMMLGNFGLRFLFGNQYAIAMGEFHLHVRDAGACRCSSRVLNGKFRDTGEFPQPGKIALLRMNEFCLSTWIRPKRVV